MKTFFKYASFVFLALIVYPVQAIFFLLKVAGLFLYKGGTEVVDYCYGILSDIEKQQN